MVELDWSGSGVGAGGDIGLNAHGVANETSTIRLVQPELISRSR